MKLSTAALKENREPEYSFGNFRLWPDGTLYRDQTQIHLPPKELAALRFLLRHAGEVVTPAQLKEALWGEVHVTSDSVPRCLSSLRNLLEPDESIQTIYKRGYRLSGPVRRHDAEKRKPVRLAIMPFSPGHNVPEHLGAAVAEEITTRLTESGSPGVSVLARDSVFTLAGRGLTAAQVGEALQADLVLAGTLMAMPTQYRMRVEMIRVKEETQIWVEDALAAHGNLLELEAHIVQRLIVRLGGERNDSKHKPDPEPPRTDAYELFLRGHQEWQTYERHRMQEATEHLTLATELDPSLVSAQIDLADVSLAQELYGYLAPEEAARQIRRIADSISEAGREAPALLPVLGWVKFHADRDFAGALELFYASAQLPHGGLITRVRTMFALSRHRFDEALEWLQSAQLLDPYAPWVHVMRAWTLHLARRRGKSVEAIEKALSMFPDHDCTQAFGALILAFNGRADQAVKLAADLVRRAPHFDIASAAHAYALACSGQRNEAQEILERLQWLSRERFVLRSFTAAAFAALGATDEAVGELQAADATRCPWFYQQLADPRLEPLRGYREFEQMKASLVEMESSVAENLECPA
jgi:DNA-binding winged helix-turn-helix (wHTH) protein/tetratricopeptide (TPR) repeat protein